jgi:PAS domain S-box-containing protein
MALYTFYCCRADGSATAFEAHELRSEKSVRETAARLLAGHASAERVVGWLDDREVLAVTRTGQAAPPALPEGPAALEHVRGRLRSRLSDTVAVIATQADGAILFWNRGAKRLYGWSEAEAIGRNVIALTPAVQSREQAAAILAALARGEPWDGEIVLRKRDGSPFRAFVCDIPLALGGEPAAIIVGASAPTERKAAVVAYAEKLRRELAGAG